MDRQVGGLLAFEDAIDVSRRTAVLVALVRAIGDQTAGLSEVAEWIDRGQLVPRRERSDPIGMVRGKSVWRDDEPPFGRSANAAISRSISPGSPISIVGEEMGSLEPSRVCRNAMEM